MRWRKKQRKKEQESVCVRACVSTCKCVHACVSKCECVCVNEVVPECVGGCAKVSLSGDAGDRQIVR